MPVPDYQTLMLPLLRRLGEQQGPVAIREFLESVADEFALTPDERAERIPSGQENLLANRLAWARTYLGKAGLLASPKRGLVSITERGRHLLADESVVITNATLARYPEFQNWLTRSRETAVATPPSAPSETSVASVSRAPVELDAGTPRERIDEAVQEIEADLRTELLDRVRQMTPAEFEGLILRLLLAMGYGQGLDEMALALGGSGDGGVDGVIHQDPLGLDRVYVQAKRYKEGNNVGSVDIRGFVGALNINRATKGVFVAASQFTLEAKRAADGATMQVVLIDGDQLTRLMVRHKVGVLVRSTVEIKSIDEGFFST
ncbi:restriction endonuclease [Sphingomonas sp. ABOLD]|uniref:Restriction system protein n=1 Tax=Sphingomonas trueperi TaxID=53317 RepID=A0A7X5Y1F6_9SPHN|nr:MULTISPECIES: restriction endonuclease [Sphingomonas]NJB98030.1 restriction system protein [Sphingomonas trueperi]RSV46324.1 restriction endonuclease [Sphingomonas sp. ABOLD]